MEEMILDNKTVILFQSPFNELCFQINFLDALSSLLFYINENSFIKCTKEQVYNDLNLIHSLINLANEEDNYISLSKYVETERELYDKILEGLSYKIKYDQNGVC